MHLTTRPPQHAAMHVEVLHLQLQMVLIPRQSTWQTTRLWTRGPSWNATLMSIHRQTTLGGTQQPVAFYMFGTRPRLLWLTFASATIFHRLELRKKPSAPLMAKKIVCCGCRARQRLWVEQPNRLRCCTSTLHAVNCRRLRLKATIAPTQSQLDGRSATQASHNYDICMHIRKCAANTAPNMFTGQQSAVILANVASFPS